MPSLALIQHWMSLELPTDFNEEKENKTLVSTPHHLFFGCILHKMLCKSVHVFLLPYIVHVSLLPYMYLFYYSRSVFKPIPKKENAKECSNYCTIVLILYTSKVMLKILQARLQQYVNPELQNVQAGCRKGRRTRDQIANIRWIIEKAREFQKNIYFCFIHYAKASDCVDDNKLCKILKEMGIPDHLTCLLRNPYAGQEATVRIEHETTDLIQIGKGVHQGCISAPW